MLSLLPAPSYMQCNIVKNVDQQSDLTWYTSLQTKWLKHSTSILKVMYALRCLHRVIIYGVARTSVIF